MVSSAARGEWLTRGFEKEKNRPRAPLTGGPASLLLAAVSEAAKTDATKSELRGSVLDVARELLGEHPQLDLVLTLIAKLASRNEELEQLLARLRTGKNHSEGISSKQLDMFLAMVRGMSDGEVAEANKKLEGVAKQNGGRPEEPKPPKQPPVRRPPPANAPRVDNPILVPEAERPCPRCGADRKCVNHETTEVIDLIPAKVIVRLDRREVLACPACDAMERAPMGDKVVAGGAYGSGLVSHLVVGKFRNSLPLDRQRQELERLGLSMPSSSMSDQIMWATDLLRPIWRALIAAVLGSVVMHIDGTTLDVRDKETKHQIVHGQLWGCVGDAEHAVYLFTSTGKKLGQRPGEIGPEQLLAMRKGAVCADAATLFEKSFKRPDLIEIGCNMHGRRGFKKALELGDARAAVPLKAFQALYDVEASARDADDDARLAERQRRSKPIYNELLAWCELHRPIEPPASALAKAIGYVLNQRAALTRFLDDGRMPIDNGVVERLHRIPAIGRRNFLYAGSYAGGERAAIAYSVIASCELVDVNPEEYLADVLPRLQREGVTIANVGALLPASWKAARTARETTADATPACA
jgi:transposase